MSLNVGTLVAYLELDTTRFNAGITASQAKAIQFGDSLKSAGESVAKFGSKLTLAITAPLTIMGALAVKTAASFDDSMRQVAAVTSATGDQFDMLRQQAIDLGASTAWSASEAADAMKYLGMAGLTVNEIYAATPQMLSLASAGALELGTAADIATNVLSGFNLSVEDLAHVSDILAQAASTSNTSVEQLGSAMSYVGPVASAASQSIEMTTAAIQVMSNAGIQGTMAGTALRTSLSSLLAPTTEATTILASYGITASQVNPEIHSLSEIVDTLGTAGLSTADAMTIFGDRAGPGMLTLLSAGGQTIEDYAAKLEDCDGVAQEMAETMEGGLGGSFRELEGKIETLSITFGDLVADALMPVMVAIGDMADWLSHLDKGTQQAIVVTALFAAGLGPALWAIGSMATGVGALVTMYGVFQASTIAATIATKGLTVAIMTNPVGLAVVAITALAAVMLPLIMRTDDATVSQKEYNEAMEDAANVTKVTDDELNSHIETLIKKRDYTREIVDLIYKNQIAEDGLTDSIEDQAKAYANLTDYQKEVVAKLKEQDAAIAIYMTEQAVRSLAEGAETAFDEASKAVDAHKDTISELQGEYNDLKETIDRALGIDEEIKDADNAVERADIKLIRARKYLAEIQAEIKELESAASYGDPDAQEKLADRRLDERDAILDVSDALDSYNDAVDKSATIQADKVAIEAELNGDSIESAQDRLDTIGAQLKTEQGKLDVALAEQEEAQIAHENLMNQIDTEALATKSENWKTYVDYVASNPAIAKTYHVEYDDMGNAIGGLPSIPTVSASDVPTYAAFSADDLVSYTTPIDTTANTTIGPQTMPEGTMLTAGSTVTNNNSPTVNIYAQTGADKNEIAITAYREVGRLYTGGFGI